MSNPYQPFDYEAERRRAAATRDYTTPAIITLVLYFIFWLPGLVANIVYYLQAQQDERLTGHAPQGKGCLLAMLIVWVVVPVVLVVLGCAMFAVFGSLTAVSSG